uniref:Uncharacterized protein n=1 Tax=Setaria italica TaxID=4555 RepID=K3XTN2_SETIT
MYLENTVAVLTLAPATVLRIATYSEPPPTLAALEMAAAKKESAHARAFARPLCEEDSIGCSCDLHWDR